MKNRKPNLVVKTKQRVIINQFKKITHYNKLDCQDPTEQNTETYGASILNEKCANPALFSESKQTSFSESPGHLNNVLDVLRSHNNDENCSSRQAQVSETNLDSSSDSYANNEPNYNIVPSNEPTNSDAAILNIKLDRQSERNVTSVRERKHGLDQNAFTALLLLLDEDLSRAAEKYAAIRAKLETFFDGRGCMSSADMADETINRVARRVRDGATIFTGDPLTYFYGVAKNLLREYWSSRERQFLSIENLAPSEHPRVEIDGATGTEERQRVERMLQSLETSLSEMSDEHRKLLMRYYAGEKRRMIDNRKALAEEFGLSDNALRIRVHRLRLALEHQVSRRLASQKDL
ncbi:MAG TPA: hypothetical protein VFC63_10325 [Blastocatellia bacterium]|nr:hypothetical protein [Blastocatellia bacterium]